MATISVAWAINNLGQVVGESTTALDELGNYERHAFLWTRETGMVDLSSARTGPNLSVAYAINDLGQIVGRTQGCDAAIREPDGSVTTLGSLGGGCSIASGINDHGKVVGQSNIASGNWHEFLWARNTGMTDLGSVGLTTYAIDISKTDEVVGFGYDLAGGEQATLWEKQSGLTLLGTLGGCCAAAAAINESGEIVGYSNTSTGSYHATRWTISKHAKKAKP